MFFISGMRIISPSTNQGEDQTYRDLSSPTIFLRPFNNSSLPKRMLLQAYERQKPKEAGT